MDEILWKLLAFIVMIYMVILMPLLFTFERQEDILSSRAISLTQEFADRIRDGGVLYDSDLQRLNNQLSLLGQVFDIKLEYMKKSYMPQFNELDEPIGSKAVLISESEFDIISTIEREGAYYMKKGDFFYVTVRSTNKSFGQSLKKVLLGIDDQIGFYARGGGIVRNEDY